MIRIYDDTKIYVQCPGDIVTGGAELLHQLVSYLRDNGKDAYIVYFGKNRNVPEAYKEYNIEVAAEIEDSPHNISVLYEILFYQALESTKIQKVLWWMSVDNFYLCGSYYLSFRDLFKWDVKKAFRTLFARIYHNYIKRDNLYLKHPISLKQLSKVDAVSAYQSEYAQNHLYNNGFKELVPLKDYINLEHCSRFKKEGRQNIVLYNPKKGIEFTKKLIKAAPDIKWVPIINMTREQVKLIMQQAKVYIDFGNHPGKDRLPRECAMNGLCVITGSRGSAGFFEDVWLERKYKFDESVDSISNILNTIRFVLENYETAIEDFAFYRARISEEKLEFEKQISDIFIKNVNSL